MSATLGWTLWGLWILFILRVIWVSAWAITECHKRHHQNIALINSLDYTKSGVDAEFEAKRLSYDFPTVRLALDLRKWTPVQLFGDIK